jgi:hypothetical protein
MNGNDRDHEGRDRVGLPRPLDQQAQQERAEQGAICVAGDREPEFDDRVFRGGEQ